MNSPLVDHSVIGLAWFSGRTASLLSYQGPVDRWQVGLVGFEVLATDTFEIDVVLVLAQNAMQEVLKHLLTFFIFFVIHLRPGSLIISD